ncbi:hypothetical protein M6B38_302090 [Iris pallida]|uniref:Uncharacterized protein n=1 Tax=Iris pallida TaxID=29817 RepID=A0AAX6GBI1_IRIPA|nr:hypothetical protein M6B38_377215 [Iris pallida]KAJ6842345.1 hypothetical protein M6B38_302090 [Iris pallida]
MILYHLGPEPEEDGVVSQDGLRLQYSRLDHFLVLFRVCIMYIVLRFQYCILFMLPNLSPDDIVSTWWIVVIWERL